MDRPIDIAGIVEAWDGHAVDLPLKGNIEACAHGIWVGVWNAILYTVGSYEVVVGELWRCLVRASPPQLGFAPLTLMTK